LQTAALPRGSGLAPAAPAAAAGIAAGVSAAPAGFLQTRIADASEEENGGCPAALDGVAFMAALAPVCHFNGKADDFAPDELASSELTHAQPPIGDAGRDARESPLIAFPRSDGVLVNDP
jgi:hypothetical protein